MNGQSVVMSALVVMLHLVESMGGRIALRPEGDKYHNIDRRDGHNIAANRIIRSLRSANDEHPLNLGSLGMPPSPAKPNQGAANKSQDTDYDYADDSDILDDLPSTGDKAGHTEQQVGGILDSSPHFSVIKSSLYDDYEFDVTGTDQVDDEDVFLRKHYGPQSRRRVYDHQDQSADLLWVTGDDGWNESGYMDDPSDYDASADTIHSDDYDASQNEW